MDAGADRVAPGVGEPDPGDQPAGGAHRLFDDAGIDVYEPQNTRSVPSPGTSPQARPRWR